VLNNQNHLRNQILSKKQEKIADAVEELEVLFQEHFVVTLDPGGTLEMISETIDRLSKLRQELLTGGN